MKKLLLIISLSFLSVSCNRYVNVKLINNSIVRCYNESLIDYPQFTQVCVHNNRNDDWFICIDGEMKDTTIFKKYGPIKHRVGKITKLF
jgi:hypothetical protein